MCKISIIVPIYAIQKKYLIECIDSLVHQTLQDLEIILIDDGSPDECGMICDSYASKYSEIIAVHQNNEGVSCARNRGIALATGKYILFVDGDDYIAHDACEKLYAQMETSGAEILLYGHICKNEYMEVEHRLGKDIFFPKEKISELQKAILNPAGELLKIAPAGTVGKMYRLDFLRKYNLKYIPGVKRMQDNLFCLYAYQHAHRIFYYDYLGYCYRINGDSVCNKYNPDIFEILENALREFEAFVVNQAPYLKPYYYCKVVSVLVTEYLHLYFRNSNNPYSAHKRKREFRNLLLRKPYAEALKEVNLSLLSPRLKISTFFLKFHLFGVWWFLLDLEEFIHIHLKITTRI